MWDTVQARGRLEQSVGAERLEMPRALWARSDAAEWGYLMRLEVDDGVLAPGEPVQVGLLPPS